MREKLHAYLLQRPSGATPQELLDLVFTVGQYHLVSMALNAFRAARDDDVTGVPMPVRE